MENLVSASVFREDFYYRIVVYPILLPPLRDRRSDILPIAMHFFQHCCRQINKPLQGLDPEAEARLMQYDWPGNVRQLRNVIERAVILAEGSRVSAKDLGLPEAAAPAETNPEPIPRTKDELKHLKKKIRRNAVDEVEKKFLLQALVQNNWNISRAAKETGLQRTNFQNLMKKHAISVLRPPQSSPSSPEGKK
jgi:DNA-binding NtrC family response regulator